MKTTTPHSTRPRASLPRRLATYQAERFPLLAYVPMVLAAAFAAVAWSRAARDAAGFVPVGRFLAGAFTMLVFFVLLRVADEHKDAVTDRAARPELPVPRGLVTLDELRTAGTALGGVALMLNALVAPPLLWPLLAVVLWGALMTKEFFAADWLRAQPSLYLVSHMVIMPLVMLYGTAIDWLADGSAAPRFLLLFLAATYLNGLVLEVGRKLKEPAAERLGVDTYTAAWGRTRAVGIWVAALLAAATAVGAAMIVAGMPAWLAWLLPIAVALPLALPAASLLRGAAGSGKRVEAVSGVWNLIAYVLLALPWLLVAVG